MTAKEYLGQIRCYHNRIEEKKREIEELRDMATCIGSFDYSKDPVKTSPSGDAMVNAVAKIVDAREECARLIVTYLEKKNVIIREINEMSNETYRKLLYKRYVEYKRLEQIAVEMNYQYEWIRQLHGRALQDFERTYTNIHKDDV